MNAIRQNLDNDYLFIHNQESNRTFYQGGVVRTNCLDCLDRTNITQAHISLRLLGYILDQLVKNLKKKDPSAQFFDIQAQVRELQEALKRMWTENGDKLSMQYTGTGSNISGVLEEGK